MSEPEVGMDNGDDTAERIDKLTGGARPDVAVSVLIRRFVPIVEPNDDTRAWT